MRFAQFDSAQDAEVGVTVATSLHASEVFIGIDRQRVEPTIGADTVRRHQRLRLCCQNPSGGIDVFGERDRGQTELEGSGAGVFHRSRRGVPGPLGMDVVVRRQDGPGHVLVHTCALPERDSLHCRTRQRRDEGRKLLDTQTCAVRMRSALVLTIPVAHGSFEL